MTFLQLIGIIGAFTIFVFVSWWCINQDCSDNIDKYLMQKLNELEQEVKELKEELSKLRKQL